MHDPFFLQTKFTGLIFKNYGETMTLPCKMGPLLLWDITPLVNILNFCIQYITSNAKMHWKHTFLVFCNEKSLSYYKLCCQRLDVVLCHDQNLRELSINVRSWVKIFFITKKFIFFFHFFFRQYWHLVDCSRWWFTNVATILAKTTQDMEKLQIANF